MSRPMTPRVLALLAMAAWFSLVADQTEEQTPAPPALPKAPPSALPNSLAAADSDSQPTMLDDKATIEAAEKWLALLDASKFGTAWDASSAHLKSVVTRQKWMTEIAKTRKPYGKLR